MQRVKLSGKKSVGVAIAVLCVAVAIFLSVYVAHRDGAYPSSDDASIDADVVHVASTVGGRLIDVRVQVNQAVHKGDVLYRIDPEPYELIVRQAEANLALATAEVENQQRLVAVKTANASSALEQVKREEVNRDLAARTVDRLRPLAGASYIPWQEYDQARVTLRNTETSLSQARNSSFAANTAIGDLKSSLAAQAAAQATLDHARYELQQVVVRASVDGYVSSLRVKVGEVLAPAQVLFTLVANDEWFASANIRELNLGVIHPGTCATVYSMIDRHTPIRGHVDSIGWGVLSADSAGIGRSLPLVQREMDWVHVAQRFPVRIRLDNAPRNLLRMGASATVEINHGAACP